MQSALVLDGRYRAYENGEVYRIQKDGTEERVGDTKGKYSTLSYYAAPGEWKTVPIHRLIAGAFVPNPEGKREVNHIDGNTHNNAVSNLEWVSHEENIAHAWKTGLIKRTPEEIRVFSSNLCRLKAQTGESNSQLAKIIGVSRTCVSNWMRGKNKPYYAYLKKIAEHYGVTVEQLIS